MSHKKQQLAKPTEQDSLIEKVDAMMDLKRPESVAPKPVEKPASEPLDIFAGLKTAPKLDEVTELKPEAPKTAPEPKPDLPKVEPEAPQPIITHKEKTIQPALKPLPKPVQVRDEFDDPETDKAVDEITKSEGDAFFAAQDAAANTVEKPSFFDRLKKLFK